MDNSQTKFGRNYSARIQTSDGSFITVTLPFTMEFDVATNDLSSAQTATFRIYNLSQKNRDLIRKDTQSLLDFRTIEVKAGYGQNIPVIFSGNIQQAWSVREGVNFITEISCFSGLQAFLEGQTSNQFPAGTTRQTIIETLVNSLPGVSTGSIGSYPGDITRGNSYSGSTTDLLSEMTGGGFFINNGKAYCLNDNECIPAEIQVISPASGLLNTPVREELNVSVELLFSPNFILTQKVQLVSFTGVNFNGFYKVYSIHHRGMISESVCGDATSTIGLINSNGLVNA